MNYSKLQKITSGSVIFVLLFSITFRIPFFSLFNSVSAADKDFYNLVSIIVNEDIYDSISSEVERYAKDIQGVLENTRAIILPVPSDTEAFNIASLNEGLYFEGYSSLKDVSFESKLVGTVLIGNLAVPLVANDGKTAKSIVPYTDFEDKTYIYDHESTIFQKNTDSQDVLSAEIWHGVISPNNGDGGQDILDIKGYFDKNHDFYQGSGNFEMGNDILNGNIREGVSENYEPFVFYFDQFREEKSIHYPAYKGYLAYLQNKEDLAYYRFNKDLADRIKDEVVGAQEEEMAELIGNLNSNKLDLAFLDTQGPDASTGTDIMSRFITNETVKKFIEIFNEGQIDDFKTNVHNAGRYNGDGAEVNVDMIPYLISVLDTTSDEVMKSVNNDLENIIDDLVTRGLSRKIAIPTEITYYDQNINSYFMDLSYLEENPDIYTNILYGKQGKDIEEAIDCSIYRGSTTNGGTLVEANRGLNLNLIQGDVTKCLGETTGFWGGNSPINLNFEASANGQLELNSSRDINKSIVPLFDIMGSKKVEDESKVPSPLNCLDNNFLVTQQRNSELGFFHFSYYSGIVNYRAPINGNTAIYYGRPTNWCDKTNKSYEFDEDFQSIYESVKNETKFNEDGCFIEREVYLNGENLGIGESAPVIESSVPGVVIELPQSPVANSDSVFAHSGSSKTIYVLENDTDENNDDLVITGTDSVVNGIVTFTNQEIVFTPNAGFVGMASFNYTIKDSSNLTSTSTVVINVVSENNSPIVSDDIVYVHKDFPKTIDVLKNDTDTEGDNLIITNIINVVNGTAVVVSNGIRFTPTTGFVGNGSLEYSVIDGYGGTGSGRVDIVVAANTAPVANSDSETMDVEAFSIIPTSTSITIDVLANDTDLEGDNLVITNVISIGMEFEDVMGDTSTMMGSDSYSFGPEGIVYSPASGFVGTQTLEYTIEDGYGGVATGEVSIEVVAPNEDTGCLPINESYYFKTIDSHITHKSPTPYELSKEIQNPITPNLPIDVDRYIDFIGVDGEYKKIEYPKLFEFIGGDDYSIEAYRQLLDEYLDAKSLEINNYLADNNISLLAGDELEVYNLLKTGNNFALEIDLKAFLENKPFETIEIGGEEKVVNYYDFLNFSVYWNNLTNVSAKYKFVIENYLSDQVGGNDFNFILPKNKKEYEIAYLGAIGDTQNMYIKMDPEAKGVNPYDDLISLNFLLSGDLMSLKILNNTNAVEGDLDDEGLFECSPPDGVPIWEWIPAIICRINNMLPPSIGISDGQCGETFMSEEEIEEIKTFEKENDCDGDLNKNGINDCIEIKLRGATLNLSSDKEKYYYGSSGKLDVILKDSAGRKVFIDNTSFVKFELSKVVDIESGTTVYNSSSQDLEENPKLIKDHVLYRDFTTRLNHGEIDYGFGAKNIDTDLYFKATINRKDNTGASAYFLESEEIKVSIRGDKLFVNSSRLVDGEIDLGRDIVSVSSSKNIYIYDEKNTKLDSAESLGGDKLFLGLSNISKAGEKLNLDFPLSLNIYDSLGENIYATSLGGLGGFVPLYSNTKAGNYKLEIIDNSGFRVVKDFDIIPGSPSNLDITLGSSVLEKDGALTTNIVAVYDKYDNPVTGEFLDIDLNILGNSILFAENNDKKLSFNTIEGFRAFRLLSTDNASISKLQATLSIDGKKVLTTSKNIRVVNEMIFDIKTSGDLKVGKNQYKLFISLKDENGSLISDLDSRIYLSGGKKFGSTLNPYTDLIGGKAIVDFETAFLAGKDIPFEFQIEGLKNIYRDYLTIYPEKAIKLDLKTTKSKLEASSDSYTFLNVELKDVYGNLVFNDNTTKFNVEILDEYKDIVISENSSQVASEGQASFKINATDIPGTAYTKVLTTPSLSLNTFEMEGQTPFTKDNLDGISFVRKDDKLFGVGTKLFYEVDEENYRFVYNSLEALGKDSDFLKLPQASKDEIVNLWNNTNTFVISGVGENAIPIDTFYFWKKEFIDGRKYNSIYTALLGASYGDFTEKDYLAGALLFDEENRSLAVSSLINNPYEYNDIVQISGSSAVKKVYNNSDLTQDIDIELNFDNNNIAYLDLFNDSLTTYVGKIFFNFSSENQLNICDSIDCFDEEETSIAVIRGDANYIYENTGDEIIVRDSYNNKIFTIDNSGEITRTSNVSFELNERLGGNVFFDINTGDKTIGKLGFNFVDSALKVARDENVLKGLLVTDKNSIIIKLDTDDYSVREISTVGEVDQVAIYYNDPFSKEYTLNSLSKENIYSFDNFASEEGAGWKGGNKAMLEFAAGKNVGESSKKYASVGLINLGDPIVYLKKIKEKIPNTTIDRKFDKTIGKKINTTEIAGYRTFDYNNDQKEDILFIEKNSFLKLLENKDISDNVLDQKFIARIFDIGDQDLIQAGDFTGDGFGDIFFVNNDGEAFLLNNVEKDFTRFSLDEQFSLNGKIIRTKGFDMDADGIFDIVTLDDNGDINIFYGGGSSTDPNFTKKLVSEGYGIELDENYRDSSGAVYFDGVPQLKEDGNNDDLIITMEEFNSRIDSALDSGDIDEVNSISEENISETINESLVDSFLFVELPYISGSDIPINQDYDATSDINTVPQTTFIRGQYSSTLGLDTRVVYKDQNGGFLKGDDAVSVEVTLKNTSGGTLNNIAYFESIPNYFILDNSSLENSLGLLFREGVSNYNFLLDDFSLGNGESLTITYDLTTKPLSFSYIEVGLFEEGEGGDDNYGDIIVKANEQNCSENVNIFRSTSSRVYQKGIKEPECDIDKLELPEELEKNKIDVDGNGVPDYIDELSQGVNRDYVIDIQNNLYTDSDGDGIPDIEDSSPNLGTESFLDNIDALNESIDEISEGIDTLVEGFGCGFGGGGCIASPLNRAPLAPGNDIVFMGNLIGDGLKVEEGLPFFSSLTGLTISCGTTTCCIPVFRPMSAQTFTPGSAVCSPTLGAGGRLGTNSPTNNVRLFYTPTLTGAHGFAACYGGPASAVGSVPPMGASPLIAGGNCIVAAYPMDFCSGDGSDGDPASLGVPTYLPGVVGGGYGVEDGFGIINGNCTDFGEIEKLPNTNKLNLGFIDDYIDFKRTGVASSSLSESFETVFGEQNDVNYDVSAIDPLIGVDGGSSGLSEIQVDIDLGAINKGNFEDVIQVENTRISPFPDFIMGWITRQLDEIIQKLTDFPTLFIIMPDFSGLYNADWGDYISSGVQKSYMEGEEQEAKKIQKIDEQIANLEATRQSVCTGDNSDKLDCGVLELKINDLEAKKGYGLSKQYSGIQQAYEFLSSVPIVQIEPETVNLNIPWIDETSLERTIIDWTDTLDQRKEEFANAGDSINYNAEDILDITNTINSLQRNIQTLEDYKKFPEQLSTLVNKKQDRLDQVLCNIEVISSLIGGWIGKNGIRFRAWVELYVLIKAILKSWQLLADVFIDYEAECHECKNERRDSIGWQFSLVSAIIPDIPVIQFPKWPDIVLDLHNIRVNLVVYIPDFEFNLRPIVLPTLPKLYLPRAPGIEVDFPNIPQLPTFEIPELPDIPTLPEINLPDLPPPPKLPKLFSSLEGILNILKLVTKAMCILKKSPFVPEWRAGDQIAFLTERSGYLPFDFLDVSLPQFSYPFVDAIEVVTYVNLEFETEFLVEMARVISMPLNSFTNNTRQLFNVQSRDLDFSGFTPADIDIDVELNGEVGKVNIKETEFAKMIGFGIGNLVNYLNDNKDKQVSSKEFIRLIDKELAKKSVASNPKLDELRDLWSKVNDMTYSKEDKLISNLLESHYEKFDTIKAIINTESEKNKSLKSDIKKASSSSIFEEIKEDKNNDFNAYNESLDKYNLQFIDAAKNLVLPANAQKEELSKMGDNIFAGIKSSNEKENTPKNNLLSVVNSSAGGASSTNECIASNNSDYRYKYEGIYILEQGENYRLFDYIEELNGKEEVTPVDIDGDNDIDLLYMVAGDLYLKENLQTPSNKSYVRTSALKVAPGSNKFVNGDEFYESINNFRELSLSDSAINVSFSASNRNEIDSYRLEYFTIVDKYQNEDNFTYVPELVKKFVVDAFAGDKDSTLIEETDDYSLRENVGQIDYVGMTSGVKMYTKKLKVLNEDLNNDEFVYISPNTTLYAGKSNLNISYLQGEEQKSVRLAKGTNINFDTQVKVYKIEGGDAYVILNQDIVLEGSEISDYIGLPLPFETRIEVVDDSRFTTRSHIDISYYDDSELGLDFRKVSGYELYDLGYKSEDYLIRLNVENDYLYSRISALKDDLVGTKSKQVLLSPQVEADLIKPELNYKGKIRVPVYQESTIDFSDYMYEDSGVDDIVSITIEGIPADKYTVYRAPGRVRIKFGKFEELLNINLNFTLIDENGNIGIETVAFEVYSPIPEVNSYISGNVNGNIDENLTDEPITLYRIRGGSISRLTNNVTMTDEGIFNFGVSEEDINTLTFQVDGEDSFSVDENTGKITLNTFTDKIEVTTGEDDFVPVITVYNSDGEEVFYEKIKLEGEEDIILTDSFGDAVTKPDGLYVNILNKVDFAYYIIPDGVAYNPGALVIYRQADVNSEPLFVIFKDGRIDTITDSYTLEYTSYGDYVVFKLIDEHYNKEVARVLYKVNTSYLIK